MNILNRNNSLILIALVTAITLLSGCGIDTYEEVPIQTEEVVLTRPHAYWSRNEGGEVRREVAQPGKRNFGNGPAIRYQVNTALKTSPLENLQVLMAEHINMPFSVRLDYSTTPGQTLAMVLNYLPEDSTFEISGYNGVQVYPVNVKQIFNINIQDHYEMVARDVIDEQTSKEIEVGTLAGDIQSRLVQRLRSITKPRVVLGEDNLPMISQTETISIMDVITIQNVAITGFTPPEVLREAIKAIQDMRADVTKQKEVLTQMTLKREIAIADATSIVTQNNQLAIALEQNPAMHALQRKEMFEKSIASNSVSNTTVIIVPKNMSGQIHLNMESQTKK